VCSQERLQRRLCFLRAERVDQANDAMRLEPMLDLIDEDDRLRCGRSTLKTGDEQPFGPKPETLERHPVFVMERDGSA
jgi:hypothetical protein